jgi:hypothetical protein
VTKDKDFRELPYFRALHDSVAQLKFGGGEAAQAPTASATNADAAQGSGVKP